MNLLSNIKHLINYSIFNKHSIALIGSSKSILKKKWGKKIDKKKIVIRFNKAKIKNYYEFVGRKDNLRFLNNVCIEVDFFKKNKKNFFKKKNIIISPHKIQNKYNLIKTIKDCSFIFFDSSFYQYLIIFKYFHYPNLLLNLLKYKLKKNFSVGFFAILIFSSKKNPPDLFGFDLTENMKKRTHYWEKGPKVGNVHNLSLEHRFIKYMHKKNLLNINL